MFKFINLRLAEIRKNEKNYEKKLAAYYASQVKAETEKSEQDKVLERRIREIQEYFGYWIDPKDPRFEVMLKQKEAEEKKVCFYIQNYEINFKSSLIFVFIIVLLKVHLKQCLEKVLPMTIVWLKFNLRTGYFLIYGIPPI